MRDRVVVSHVDDDHIYGVIDLLLDIREQKLEGND
jgi:beta-lactamase superfamily II metal-dependent hydrolase